MGTSWGGSPWRPPCAGPALGRVGRPGGRAVGLWGKGDPPERFREEPAGVFAARLIRTWALLVGHRSGGNGLGQIPPASPRGLRRIECAG